MILARNLFFVGGIFLFLVLMLSFLPSNTWQLHEETYPVYHPFEDYSDDLVHFLVKESFSLKIKRVEADTEALIVDFIVSESYPEMKAAYTDLKNLIVGGFNNFSSITDIRARILVKSSVDEQLLIGVIARRDQYKPQNVKEQWKLDKLIQYFDDHFMVTYGPAWSNYNFSTSP